MQARRARFAHRLDRPCALPPRHGASAVFRAVGAVANMHERSICACLRVSSKSAESDGLVVVEVLVLATHYRAQSASVFGGLHWLSFPLLVQLFFLCLHRLSIVASMAQTRINEGSRYCKRRLYLQLGGCRRGANLACEYRAFCHESSVHVWGGPGGGTLRRCRTDAQIYSTSEGM